MKKQRRVTALAMSSAMALATLTGCPKYKDKDETTAAANVSTTAEPTTEASTVETAKSTQTTEAPTEAPTKWAGPLTTFRDRDIEIVTGRKVEKNGSWWDSLLLINGKYEPKNQYEEDVRDYLNYFAERDHFSLRLTNMEGDARSYAASLTASIASGAPLGQLMEIDARWIPALINNHLCVPLDELSALNLSDEKWNRCINEATDFGGHVYGINADYTPGYGVFFNKRLLQEVGYGENALYDLQKNGEWNHSKFEEVLKACTKDLNGDGKTDIWGMSTSLGAHYYTAMIHAAGEDLVTKDASGKFVNQMGSEEFLSTLTWAEDMWKKYAAPPLEDELASPYERFNKGETALLIGTETDRQKFSLTDDWGFLILPSGDGKEYISVDASSVVFIPASFSKEDANEIAFVFDEVTKAALMIGTCADGDGWKEYYYGGYNDSRAVDETLQIMKRGKNIKPRLELYVQGLYYESIMNYFLHPLFAGETTPADGIKANMENWDKIIEEQNNAIKKLK